MHELSSLLTPFPSLVSCGTICLILFYFSMAWNLSRRGYQNNLTTKKTLQILGALLLPSQHFSMQHSGSFYFSLECFVALGLSPLLKRERNKKKSSTENPPREESWAQRAREAAKRDKMVLCVHSGSRGSSRHMGRSTNGRDSNRRSLCRSRGAAHGISGNTVSRHPQPFTEPSLVNFQRISSPVTEKRIINYLNYISDGEQSEGSWFKRME